MGKKNEEFHLSHTLQVSWCMDGVYERGGGGCGADEIRPCGGTLCEVYPEALMHIKERNNNYDAATL